MGVFYGVQNKQKKYAVVSSHVSRNGKASCTIGGQKVGPLLKDAGCGNVCFEGAAYESANGNTSIAGLGVPKGIQAPAIGMKCLSNSCTTGRINGRVTMINFDAPSRVSVGPGACAISIKNVQLMGIRGEQCGMKMGIF